MTGTSQSYLVETRAEPESNDRSSQRVLTLFADCIICDSVIVDTVIRKHV